MFKLFRALIDRLNLLFAAAAAREPEAEILAESAARQAELLREAQRYESEGLHAVADTLRRQAEDLDPQRPLATVLPAVEHLASDVPALTHNGNGAAPALTGPNPTKPDLPGRKH
jgi:hypothetical protein